MRGRIPILEFCKTCRTLRPYLVKQTMGDVEVDGENRRFLWKYAVCTRCGRQINVPEIMKESEANLDRARKGA